MIVFLEKKEENMMGNLGTNHLLKWRPQNQLII
jgi:hypothetical protein